VGRSPKGQNVVLLITIVPLSVWQATRLVFRIWVVVVRLVALAADVIVCTGGRPYAQAVLGYTKVHVAVGAVGVVCIR
jgi:hypothetical protein